MAEVVVRVHELTKRFGDFTAVDRVSFEAYRGDVLGYVGPNGSGKTTTIRMLLGLLLPSSGRAEVLGYDTMRQAEAIRARVGYMSQKFALYDDLTAWENLAFYAGVYGVREKARLRRVIGVVGLGGMESERASQLPIGWRQRLALATALVHDPTLLFLDEPTSGVDPIARKLFWDLIYELGESGVTTFVTTHYMDEAEHCNRVGIMHRARLLALDTPSALKRTALSGLAWDIHAQPQLEALEVLERIPGVKRTGLAGNHLRAISGDQLHADQIMSSLKQAGCQVEEVSLVEPTLEDVFLALAGE